MIVFNPLGVNKKYVLRTRAILKFVWISYEDEN